MAAHRSARVLELNSYKSEYPAIIDKLPFVRFESIAVRGGQLFSFWCMQKVRILCKGDSDIVQNTLGGMIHARRVRLFQVFEFNNRYIVPELSRPHKGRRLHVDELVRVLQDFLRWTSMRSVFFTVFEGR